MPTDKKQLKEAIRQEFKKCAEDPAHFLRAYCYIQHPQKGKIKFDLYDYQEKTLREFWRHPLCSSLRRSNTCVNEGHPP
mgnify:CR=1 FL=1